MPFAADVAQIPFPEVHTLCPASASMIPVTSNLPAIVEVDTFVTFNWVIVDDPAESVVPMLVDPVTERFVLKEPDPEIERLFDPVMNPVETPARVEVPVTFRSPPTATFPVLLMKSDCTPWTEDVPVTPREPLTPRVNPGVVVPIPTFA